MTKAKRKTFEANLEREIFGSILYVALEKKKICSWNVYNNIHQTSQYTKYGTIHSKIYMVRSELSFQKFRTRSLMKGWLWWVETYICMELLATFCLHQCSNYFCYYSNTLLHFDCWDNVRRLYGSIKGKNLQFSNNYICYVE